MVKIVVLIVNIVKRMMTVSWLTVVTIDMMVMKTSI